MPYTIAWETQGLYRRYFGDVMHFERRASLNEIVADPRFDKARYILSDYLDVLRFEQSANATLELAALHLMPQRINARLVIAAVATRADVVAELQKFIDLRFVDWPYRIFTTLEEARAWVVR